MTREHVLNVLDKYEADLKDHKPARFEGPRYPLKAEALSHVLWMCGEVRKFIVSGEMEKAMRWLGFMQGTLWMGAVYTIDSMRDHNRT